MTKILIGLIYLYQTMGSPFLKHVLGVSRLCRYSPSCSEYAKHAIAKKGLIKGIALSGMRILRCNPYV